MLHVLRALALLSGVCATYVCTTGVANGKVWGPPLSRVWWASTESGQMLHSNIFKTVNKEILTQLIVEESSGSLFSEIYDSHVWHDVGLRLEQFTKLKWECVLADEGSRAEMTCSHELYCYAQITVPRHVTYIACTRLWFWCIYTESVYIKT